TVDAGADAVNVLLNGENPGGDSSNIVLGADGILSVTGTAAPEYIAFDQDGDMLVVAFGQSSFRRFAIAQIKGILVNAGAGDDSVYGPGSGNPVSLPDTLAITIHGGAGNDVLAAGQIRAFLYGEDGNDQLLCSDNNARPVTYDGGAGNDSIRAVAGNDSITAGSGDDTVQAGGGNDTVAGGEGNDLIDAGDGTDSASGGAGVNLVTNAENSGGNVNPYMVLSS